MANPGLLRRWWAPRPMTRLQALGDLLVIGGIMLVPLIAAAMLGKRPSSEELEALPAGRMLVANALDMGMVAAVAVYLTYRAGQPMSSIGLRRFRLWPAIGAALTATLIMYAALLTLAALGSLVAHPSRQTMTEPIREIQDRMGTPSWGMILLVAGSAAVFEEILFRGFLLTRLRVLLGNWTVAIVLGMVIFAVPHVWQGWWAVLLILPVALILSVMFVRRRNLAAPMMAHFLFNFLQLAMIRVLAESKYLQKFMQKE